jgi:hypothetical protein
MTTRTRRAYIVGAYMPDGGTAMAYQVGCILERHFGMQAVAVTLGAESPDHGVREYDLKMPCLHREAMEAQITDDDVLLVNAGFSRFLFGWRVPGFKICYVQGFAQFNLLDLRLHHYVAVSDVVSRHLSAVYGLQTTVIPPYVDVMAPPDIKPWSQRPDLILPYRKGVPDVWAFSFDRLQQLLAARAPAIAIGEPVSGPMPQRELWTRISEARYLLTLSACEGFGLVPLEAMALGTLVIGYDGIGGRHYMRSGDNCAVAPFAEIERVADLLIDAVSDPARASTMAEQGRATAAHFTYSAFREAWVRELDRAFRGRGQRALAHSPSQRPAS